MKIIKILIAFLVSAFNTVCPAQSTFTEKTLPDTVVILSKNDDMTSKVIYFPSKKIICSNEDQSIGFTLRPFIEPNLTITELHAVMVNIGTCNEKDEIIILFDDDSKLTKISWNSFDCEGNCYFKINKKEIEQLATKKIKKIRLTNGRSFDSFTGELEPDNQKYFVSIFRMLKANQIYELK